MEHNEYIKVLPEIILINEHTAKVMLEHLLEYGKTLKTLSVPQNSPSLRTLEHIFNGEGYPTKSALEYIIFEYFVEGGKVREYDWNTIDQLTTNILQAQSVASSEPVESGLRASYSFLINNTIQRGIAAEEAYNSLKNKV